MFNKGFKIINKKNEWVEINSKNWEIKIEQEGDVNINYTSRSNNSIWFRYIIANKSQLEELYKMLHEFFEGEKHGS